MDRRKEQTRWKRMAILFTVYQVLFIGGVIVPRVIQGRAGWLEYSLIVVGVVASAGYPLSRYHMRRRYRALADRDWRVCRWCRFDLRGLPDKGKCPECGEDYSIDEVRQWWKDMMEAEIGTIPESSEVPSDSTR